MFEQIIYREKSTLSLSDYILVEYHLTSKTNLRDAAWAIALGQSVGNPNVRNSYETEELFEKHACKIIGDEEQLKTKKSGHVIIAFPTANLDFKSDGISQLLVHIMGGQLDIDNIQKCHVKDIAFPEHIIKQYFLGPKYGLFGAREFLNNKDKPILGGIIKPKVGITPDTLLSMVKEMVEGGVEFIKEDEIMSNPHICPLETRVPLVMNYLRDKKVIYAVCVNSDPAYILERVKRVHELGGNAIHINFWCGMGAYKSIRELNLPLFLFFQKSGDKILTNKKHQFHIAWPVICKLAGMMGVDFIHAGMIGGYMTEDELETRKVLSVLKEFDVVPSLSCGMHPGLVDYIRNKIGIDWMANVGGAISGHPGGTFSGVQAMRQAIDGNTNEPEYLQAISQWEYRKPE